MNSDYLSGKWKQLRGSVKEQWSKLTDDDLTYIDGKNDQFIGKLQERYGMAKDEAERSLNEWLKRSEASGRFAETAAGSTRSR
jgi:uncharacterized protein YjbJ (UPF0337 family)